MTQPRDEATSLPLGEARELAEMWAELAPPLHAFLARRAPPGVEAEDLLQDMFLRVIRHADTLFRAERPQAWLFQVARNALRDSWRARRRRDGRTDALDVDVPAEADTGADRAAEAELAPCLTAMIGRLAEPYRTAISLTSLEGRTQAEAARLAGVSISGMKSRVQRGRDQLRRMLVRCCAIALDVRGGVSDFHVRRSGGCGEPAAAAAGGACAQEPCASSAEGECASILHTRRLQH
jgi:RNA polymerase sigma-70 factor (ECF subfamily)